MRFNVDMEVSDFINNIKKFIGELFMSDYRTHTSYAFGHWRVEVENNGGKIVFDFNETENHVFGCDGLVCCFMNMIGHHYDCPFKDKFAIVFDFSCIDDHPLAANVERSEDETFMEFHNISDEQFRDIVEEYYIYLIDGTAVIM